ncbi:hypothetical protein HGRIS_013899 [Hohenbuehelia grisea]|uniref:Uncharacterized protein n=1 Tax=Hohenbuehelia grisea TaxID=104357 RepID=A0ABR3IX67_9AGAR
MVHFTFPLVALALTVSVAATPAPTSATTFSFAQWVDDIITNPDTALTPVQAVEAANAAAVIASAGSLQKRAWCQDQFKSAPANDAAACLDTLARLGSQGVQCTVPADRSDIQMCRIGGAQVVSSKGPAGEHSANCNDVARTGGLIFDSCWRAENTVKGSEICVGNPNFQVNILGV